METTELIIDTSSGTIVSLNDCRIVEADLLPVHHDLSDGEVSELALRHGKPVASVVGYTEEQALLLVSQFAQQFGWKYTMFTRDDVRQAVIDHYGWAESLDEKVDKVLGTRMWVKTLEDSIIREGMECIYDAVREVEEGVAL